MQTFVSILRGINVGGHRKILMADLRMLYQELGFDSIRTYIQSGNLVFQSECLNAAELGVQIEQKIVDKYGFSVSVFVRKYDEMQQIVSQNPYVHAGIEEDKLFVVFLEKKPNQDKIDQLLKFQNSLEGCIVIAQTVYLHCPFGYGRTKLSNQFIENKLQLAASTRNWKTVNSLLGMMSLN